jgi:hypothetical protein
MTPRATKKSRKEVSDRGRHTHEFRLRMGFGELSMLPHARKIDGAFWCKELCIRFDAQPAMSHEVIQSKISFVREST